MKTITIRTQSHTYPVYIGYKTALKQFHYWIKSLPKTQNIIVITSPKINPLYKIGNFKKIIIADDEKNKNLKTAQKVIHQLICLKADRHTLLVAFGGGVIGDLTGFIASIYLRGIPFVSIPTTLLSQVDSSIGGKCGINFPQGKNLIGSFYHPKAVFCDPSFLRSLSERDFKSGLGEIIKYSILDRSLYKDLLQHKKEILERKPDILEKIIFKCLQIKKKYIECDEKDYSKRHALNLGHTVGHALETSTHYCHLTHGEAIAQGLYFASALSLKKKLCRQKTAKQIHALLRQYEFYPQKISSQV